MSKEEFLDRLKEDKFFENPQELIDYRLPIVQYYLTNYTNVSLMSPDGVFSSKDVTIVYKPEDFILVNYAYERIKEKFK